MKLAANLSILAIGLLASQLALAADCSLTIDSNDAMQFSADELTVDASCKQVELTLTHSGTLPRNAMGHNWVLTTDADAQAAYQDGMQAGIDNEYVKPGDTRVIAYTPVIGGGESTTITFSLDTLEAGGKYTFFCSFPGHFALMKGQFHVVDKG